MLKLIYTSDGLILEAVSASLESTVSQRLKISLAASQPFYVENSTATLLLKLNSQRFLALQKALDCESTKKVEASVLDQEFVEVTMAGVWLTEDPESESGVFLATLNPESEKILYEYWELSELQVA